ncbi:hypothetical protein [Corynebacterium yonathiae]|uniref:Uncharacterized protein n=1 Tax=Corynebacterium yonathiae TaxID=2913504 RepID=A0A9X3M0E4_9CORY|nr:MULTISPECIES: hypothetical protein [Corynebacterium]MCZ9296395.1 hypothetical protein [Corynebacterium yonathiae]MDK2583429.1 hypothetical protein [Corynebacterium sp. BWA136]
MPLKRPLPLVTIGTLLSACSTSDHEEESTVQADSSTTSSSTPTATSRSYDLNTKSGFIYHIKEHGTIPDYYLNMFGAGASDDDDGPTSYDVNATSLKKAGNVACKDGPILDNGKYLLSHGDKAFEELVPDFAEFDRKYAPIYEAFDMTAAAPLPDKLFTMYMARVGSLATCGKKFDDEELEAIADTIFSY